MKKVAEVSKLTGVTKRALHIYDTLGLLPAGRTEHNYRVYDEAVFENLWQILFYQEMGFKLDEIKTLMGLQKPELEAFLNQRIEKMMQSQAELEERIQIIQIVKLHGMPEICIFEENPGMPYRERIKMLEKAMMMKEEVERNEEK